MNVVNPSSMPKPSTGLFLMKGTRFLMLKRRGSHGEGTWGLVGGTLEWMETISQAASRECYEECGVEIDPSTVRIGPVVTDLFPTANKHFLDILTSAPLPENAIPRIMEADKAIDIGWFTFDDLPAPLFSPLVAFLNQPLRPPFSVPEMVSVG